MRPSPCKTALLSAAAVLVIIMSTGCSDGRDNPSPKDMKPVTAASEEVPDDEIRRMAERSDVKIKLRRNKDGTYSYEISGDDPQSVIEADRQLDAYVGNNDESKR